MTDKSSKSTIVDVARVAGVSIGTVSNFLNGQSLRPANRRKVEDAIAELGFSRNQIAVAMKTTKSRLVGILVPSLSEFHSAFVEQVSTQLGAQDRALLTVCHKHDPNLMRRALSFFQEQRVSAVIIAAHRGFEPDLLALKSHGTPVIGVTNDGSNLDIHRVSSDGFEVSRKAAQHLANLGHKRIGVLAGNLEEASARERLNGFKQGIRDCGLTQDNMQIIHGQYKANIAYASLNATLDNPNPPTAILSCSGSMTFGVLQLLQERKLSSPEDMSLITFDDSAAFRLRESPISVLVPPHKEMAEAIGDLLPLAIDDQPAQASITRSFDYELILRSSTGRPARP